MPRPYSFGYCTVRKGGTPASAAPTHARQKLKKLSNGPGLMSPDVPALRCSPIGPHGFSRPRCHEQLPFSWVDPYSSGSVDLLRGAILRIVGVTDIYPLVFAFTHLMSSLRTVDAIRVIDCFSHDL